MACKTTNWRQWAAMAVLLAGVCPIAAAAQTLTPEIAAKAKNFKVADNKYLKMLCDGSKAERVDAKTARDRLETELNKAISDLAALSSEVQKALDVATEASETVDKVAANANASDKDKADANAKLQKAKNDLRDAIAKERGIIEAQLAKDPGVTLAAKESCPDEPKATEKKAKTKIAKTKQSRGHAAAERGQAAVPTVGGSFTFGGGGIGVSIGR